MKVLYIFQENIAFRKESDDYVLKDDETIEDYNFQFIKPSIENHKYIESATQEEIEAHQRSLIPSTAKNMKFRLALIKAGISLNAINNAINSMPDGVKKEQIQTLWEFADFFERTDATLIGMAQSLGITSEQLDNLFIISNQ